ncbi:MAG TPA: endonuclease/exonuclease/phosphatase family protein [Planctomycetaceae bacterium]|nr:endonuclease/exonuclease/phosphatase family protein [Planctomycetaceae bacterium]
MTHDCLLSRRTAPAVAVLALLSWGATMAQDEAAARSSVRVMTFNIRYDNARDGENAWPHRRDWVARIIRSREADVVGCQEALRSQIADLEQRLPGYAWYGVGRDDGEERGEFVPVFYLKDRFEPLERASFWLSEAPQTPGSSGWDASLPRVTSVVRLTDRRSGATLLVVNTHFDHRGAEARLGSARLVKKEIAARRRNDEAVVFMGDLNCTPESAPYRVLAAEDATAGPVLKDARGLSRMKPAGPLSTWNGFAQIAPDTRIDYIFVAGPVGVESYRTIDESRDGRFPSDHLPVMAELAFSRPAAGDGSVR